MTLESKGIMLTLESKGMLTLESKGIVLTLESKGIPFLKKTEVQQGIVCLLAFACLR